MEKPISVREENANNGNHSIAIYDYRLKNYRYITFKMKDNSVYSVYTETLREYLRKNHKKCFRVKNIPITDDNGNTKVDDNGAVFYRKLYFYLIPDKDIIRIGVKK